MDTMSQFAPKLKSLREENGLNQSQLADELGVSRGSISFYENGDRIPDIDFLAKTAEYFNVSADWLLGRSTERTFDSDIQKVHQYTGLTSTAIRNISNEKTKQYTIDAYNFLLENKRLLDNIISYLACFTLAEYQKAPYKYIPLMPGRLSPYMPDVYFSSVIRRLEKDKAKFEEKYGDDEEFKEKSILGFLLKYADYDECKRYIDDREYERTVEEERRRNIFDDEDMQDHDGGYTLEQEEEEREASFNRLLQKEREEEAEKEKAIRDFLALAGQ